MAKKPVAKAGAKKPARRGPSRAHVVFFALALVLLAVVVRAFVLQVRRNEPLKKMAEEQYLKEIEIPARRGAVYDRAGNALAVSNQVESVFAQPQKVDDPKAAAAALAKKLAMKPQEIEKKLASDRLFVWLKRRVDPAMGDDVRKLGFGFVGIVPETRRYYPNRALFSHVLGAVDVDGHGVEGLERVFETELAGTPMAAVGLRDARGHTVIFDVGAGSEGMQGSDVHLTVDREIQSLTEAALAEGVQAVKARSGSAIVLDPKTGDVLALASYPEFNPNSIDKTPMEVRRNRAVTDAFEPGSTFKTILMAAALEEGLVRPTDQVFCENGTFRIGGETIHDTHPHGVLSAKKIIASSSNIGVAKIAVQLGRERFAEYIRAFGFGQKTGLELPGESPGIVRPAKKWPLIQLATIAFGQGISVSALQLASAYGAVANGGVLHKPRLVRMLKAPDGSARLFPRPPGERVLSPETAKILNAMLQAVVSDEGGTGPKAQIPGVLTAGKTGTAQKAASAGGYAPDKYVSNFVGFAPADAPALVVAVMIDEPEKGKHLGGVAAAPVFQKVASGALSVLGLLPAGSIAAAPLPIETTLADVALPEEEESTISGDGELPPASDPSGVVPDFRGLTLKEALDALKKSKLPLEPEVQGSGKIVSQEPAPGTKSARAHKLKWILASSRLAHAVKGERRAAR
ncbi:MAG: transpeptidase family protein [Deltaproteobacteria bacterium]|nr:transpeptidase family protein [Deltaproteobacteria bacterium]